MGKRSKKRKKQNSGQGAAALNGVDAGGNTQQKMRTKEYEAELFKLQVELVKLQEWVKATNARVVIIFEGRDAAGKGGIIKRIIERVSPRVFRLVALPSPTERQKTQLHAQRYIERLPAGGEIVIFDRSWYNRAGVERVMGFCTSEEYGEFLRDCPSFEAFLVSQGIILLKYWLDVSKQEQHKRFVARIEDPTKRWKLSPMDLESHRRWYDYSRAARCHAGGDGYSGCAVVHRTFGRQEAGASQLHRTYSQQHSLRRDSLQFSQASEAAKGERVRRAATKASRRPTALVIRTRRSDRAKSCRSSTYNAELFPSLSGSQHIARNGYSPTSSRD